MVTITQGADGWYVNHGDPNGDSDDYETYGPFRWRWQAQLWAWKNLQ